MQKNLGQIRTPLGDMIALGDNNQVHSLQFAKNLSCTTSVKKTDIIALLQKELDLYFEEKLQKFSVPFNLSGTPFQKKVWVALSKIPYGKTVSYLDIAKSIGQPGASQAVGKACSKNPFLIVIPCHRVIKQTGEIGGFMGSKDPGIKQWLLEHEGKIIKKAPCP